MDNFSPSNFQALETIIIFRRFVRLHPRRMELANMLSKLLTQKPRYGDFRELNPIVFPGKACPGTPPCLGNRSVFILDPRLCFVKRLSENNSIKNSSDKKTKKKVPRGISFL